MKYVDVKINAADSDILSDSQAKKAYTIINEIFGKHTYVNKRKHLKPINGIVLKSNS